MSKRTVALAGATGHLGSYISSAFISAPFRERFDRIILLSRKRTPQLDKLAQKGAEILNYDEKSCLAEKLRDIDVLIDMIGPEGHAFKDRLIMALKGTPVQLYIPSEFGVDHTIHDFSHPEWDAKKSHVSLARKVAPELKICQVFAGLFLEDSIGPWFGFDTKEGEYECVGDPKAKISFTGLGDVGRAVAALVCLPLEEIPSKIHLAGTTASFDEVARIMGAESGKEVRVRSIGLKEYKRELLKSETRDPDVARYLRFLMGEGKIDHERGALGNDCELVNQGEALWKWKGMGELGKETGGRPWVDWKA